jgi:hypothetical protein
MLFVFSGVRVARSLVLCVCFVDVVCPFVFFDIRIMITPLVFSNSSYTITIHMFMLSLLHIISSYFNFCLYLWFIPI